MPAQSGMERRRGANNQTASLTVCQELFSTVCTLNCTRKCKRINYSRAAFYLCLNTLQLNFVPLTEHKFKSDPVFHMSVVIDVFSWCFVDMILCLFPCVSYSVWVGPSVFVCIFMSLGASYIVCLHPYFLSMYAQAKCWCFDVDVLALHSTWFRILLRTVRATALVIYCSVVIWALEDHFLLLSHAEVQIQSTSWCSCSDNAWHVGWLGGYFAPKVLCFTEECWTNIPSSRGKRSMLVSDPSLSVFLLSELPSYLPPLYPLPVLEMVSSDWNQGWHGCHPAFFSPKFIFFFLRRVQGNENVRTVGDRSSAV